MRNLTTIEDKSLVRIHHPLHGWGDHEFGCFLYDHLRLIAANGDGWDHVSVSLATRCPTWEEMETIKRLLFHPHEVVIQYHVAVKDHINVHPYVLHMWRPHNVVIPLPPKDLI